MIVEWTEPARDDLHNVFDFVAFDNPTAATRLIEKMLSLAEALSQFPNLGREGQKKSTRELVIAGTPYFLSYRITEKKVQILAVIHGARQWPD